MAKNKLHWITEGGEGRYIGDDGSLGWLSKEANHEVATTNNTTSAELAEYCDLEAEGANYHNFCGVHAKLAALIVDRSSEQVARSVMYEVALAGGLHEYNS